MVKTLSRLDILLSGNDGKFAIDEYLRLRDAGEPIPDELRRFIDEALRRQHNGESLDKAFGLKRRRGGQVAGNEERDSQMGMVLRVLELVDSRECDSETVAVGIVADENGLSERSIQIYLKRDRALAREALNIKKWYESLIARARSRK